MNYIYFHLIIYNQRSNTIKDSNINIVTYHDFFSMYMLLYYLTYILLVLLLYIIIIIIVIFSISSKSVEIIFPFL